MEIRKKIYCNNPGQDDGGLSHTNVNRGSGKWLNVKC